MRDGAERGLVPRNGTPPAGDGADGLTDLLVRCGEGDRAALRALYGLQAARLRGVALRVTGDPALAEDVLHDVFVALMQSASKYDPLRSPAGAYLTMTTRFAAMEASRRRRRGPVRLDETAEDAARSVLDAARFEDGTHLETCLAKLEPKARHLIVLSFAEGSSHAELSARFSMPLGTVKSVIRRGLVALRRCLDQ